MGKFSNINKMVSISSKSWLAAKDSGLAGLRTIGHEGNKLVEKNGHRFINMVSCSYLGLNRHPEVIAGALSALQNEGEISSSVSRVRIAPALVDEVENNMSQIFKAETILTVSCTAASASVLPLLASGLFTKGQKPSMIFDKNCHFSMNVMKASCADEAEDLITSPHNDLNFIEDLCKRKKLVAYIADGAYSMGGNTPIDDLKTLQDKYGLFLYLDDSHSISVMGRNGEGLVCSSFQDLPERTIMVGSLAKAFGATGGVIAFNKIHEKFIIEACGGPLGWSQMINAPALGAINASAKIHLSSELVGLQNKLAMVMDEIDRSIKTENAGNGLPIRVINLPNVEDALKASHQMYLKGFYCSAVFFPIVASGNAGLRIMGRANLENTDIHNLKTALTEILHNHRDPEAVYV